jgi:hypothetical protein
MQDFAPEVFGRSKLFKSLAAVILALPVLLVGCSSVPDWADPTDWFDDESPTPQTANASGEDGAIPPLASVPDETRSISSAEERAADVEGLQTDQSASRYSDAAARKCRRQRECRHRWRNLHRAGRCLHDGDNNARRAERGR